MASLFWWLPRVQVLGVFCPTGESSLVLGEPPPFPFAPVYVPSRAPSLFKAGVVQQEWVRGRGLVLAVQNLPDSQSCVKILDPAQPSVAITSP